MKTTVIDRHKKNGEVPYFDIYIGRRIHWQNIPASKWKNPYIKGRHGTLEEIIEKHRLYLLQNDELLEALHELHGKILGCWCKPAACHGDTLAKYADIVFEATQAAGRKLSSDEIREILTRSEVVQ